MVGAKGRAPLLGAPLQGVLCPTSKTQIVSKMDFLHNVQHNTALPITCQPSDPATISHVSPPQNPSPRTSAPKDNLKCFPRKIPTQRPAPHGEAAPIRIPYKRRMFKRRTGAYRTGYGYNTQQTLVVFTAINCVSSTKSLRLNCLRHDVAPSFKHFPLSQLIPGPWP